MDLLITDVDEDLVRRVEAEAERHGLSRDEYLRRAIIDLADSGLRGTTSADLARSAELLADLGDEAVIRRAWS